MNKLFTCLSIVMLMLAHASGAEMLVSSAEGNTPSLDEGMPRDSVVRSEDEKYCKSCVIEKQFIADLAKRDFFIHAPTEIAGHTIPKIDDNIKTILQYFFSGQEEVFFSFRRLLRYDIKKKGSKVSASLYCFQFGDQGQAKSWFNTVDKTKPIGNPRVIIFSKPKKLMALVGKDVVLIEGYYMSNFKILHFLIKQMKGVEAVLGPKTTTWK